MSGPQAAFLAALPESGVPALLAACRSRCAASELPLHLWERTYESPVSTKVPTCRLDFALADGVPAEQGMLRTKSVDALNIIHFARQRSTPCIEAHRVTAVVVGVNAPEMLQTMSYTQAYEMLRRGHVFRFQRSTLSIFQICRRANAQASWEPLNDTYVVEVVVTGGDDVKGLVAEADEWVDTVQPYVTIQPAVLQGAARSSGVAVQQQARTAVSGQQVYRMN